MSINLVLEEGEVVFLMTLLETNTEVKGVSNAARLLNLYNTVQAAYSATKGAGKKSGAQDDKA
jgi:hypothetical protein